MHPCGVACLSTTHPPDYTPAESGHCPSHPQRFGSRPLVLSLSFDQRLRIHTHACVDWLPTSFLLAPHQRATTVSYIFDAPNTWHRPPLRASAPVARRSTTNARSVVRGTCRRGCQHHGHGSCFPDAVVSYAQCSWPDVSVGGCQQPLEPRRPTALVEPPTAAGGCSGPTLTPKDLPLLAYGTALPPFCFLSAVNSVCVVVGVVYS